MPTPIPNEILSYYQDGLLPEEDRKTVEESLAGDPAARQHLHQLQQLDANLAELGRYTRLRQAAMSAVKSKSPAGTEIRSHPWFVGRPAWWAPALAACLLVVVVWGSGWLSAPGGFLILRQAGEVRIVAAEPDASDPTIRIHDRIEIGQGYLALRMGDGESFVELGPQTRIELQGPRRLRVESGVVCNHVARGDNSYILDTPHGSVVVLGTVFEVRVGIRESEIRVGKGLVRVHAGSAAFSQEVPSGHQAVLRPDYVSLPAPFERGEFARWREPFRSQILDTPDIAKITSDKRFNP
ncbi:MAG: hypothetical protein HPY51_17280 [Candidatus Omnitrophica bacterium]|nr:hypothetical protein [Candidatus Omnitrophota bacterium]